MNYQSLFTEQLQQLRSEGSYRYFLELNKSAQHFPRFTYTDETAMTHSAINWCSNDYLGMSSEETVISKMGFVAHRSGAGSGGTRNISGTTSYHKKLETGLARWHRKEAALLFNGAYQANVTTLQTLGRQLPGLVFFSDERNHASIIEGIRGCKNSKRIFRHNDMDHLETLLAEFPPDQPKLIVFESVYSMSGTVAPVKAIAEMARKYNALTYADEVHAVGLYGQTGAGILEQEGLQAEIDIVNGTLSKAIGVFGGYIAASALLVDYIRSFGRGFIFTTSLPPAICAAAASSVEQIIAGTDLRQRFFANVRLLRSALQKEQVTFRPNHSHITIIPVAGADRCRELAARLLKQQGIYLQPINFPTVPVGEECLRVIITAKHQSNHINHLAFSLKKVLHGDDTSGGQGFPPVLAAAGDCQE